MQTLARVKKQKNKHQQIAQHFSLILSLRIVPACPLVRSGRLVFGKLKLTIFSVSKTKATRDTRSVTLNQMKCMN